MNNSSINLAKIQQWMNQNLSHQDVEQTLIANGYETGTVTEYLKEFTRQKRAKKQMFGFILMAIGAFIGFVACVMTIINVIPDLHDFFLFGVTMVAVSLAFYGMYIAFQE
jgi:ABC-type lipoprotein release transport system permease subunit